MSFGLNGCPYTAFQNIVRKVRSIGCRVPKDDPKYQVYAELDRHLQTIFSPYFLETLALELKHLEGDGHINDVEITEDEADLLESIRELSSDGQINTPLGRKMYYFHERCASVIWRYFQMYSPVNTHDYILSGTHRHNDYLSIILSGLATFFLEFTTLLYGFREGNRSMTYFQVADELDAIYGSREAIKRTLLMSGFLSRSNLVFTPKHYIQDRKSGELIRIDGDEIAPKSNNAVGCPAIRKFESDAEPIFHRLFDIAWEVATSELPVKDTQKVLFAVGTSAHSTLNDTKRSE